MVTLEAISQISTNQLSSDPLLEIKINEEAEPEIAFEVIELLPKIGIILTSTAGKDAGTFIFIVLCNNVLIILLQNLFYRAIAVDHRYHLKLYQSWTNHIALPYLQVGYQFLLSLLLLTILYTSPK